MKILYSIVTLFILFIFGCSTTYNVSKFSSKEKFYEDFNKSGIDKSLKVVLINDSTLKAENGAKISNDSLFISNMRVLKEEKIINKDEIRDIEYSPHNVSYTILLESGKSVIAERIKILPDSSIVILNFENVYEPIPLNQVKIINYKNHWLGVPGPLIAGTGLGAGLGTFLGYAITKINQPNINHPSAGSEVEEQYSKNEYAGLIIGSAIGFITGGIIGWVNGWTYSYEFSASGGNP